MAASVLVSVLCVEIFSIWSLMSLRSLDLWLFPAPAQWPVRCIRAGEAAVPWLSGARLAIGDWSSRTGHWGPGRGRPGRGPPRGGTHMSALGGASRKGEPPSRLSPLFLPGPLEQPGTRVGLVMGLLGRSGGGSGVRAARTVSPESVGDGMQGVCLHLLLGARTPQTPRDWPFGVPGTEPVVALSQGRRRPVSWNGMREKGGRAKAGRLGRREDAG